MEGKEKKRKEKKRKRAFFPTPPCTRTGDSFYKDKRHNNNKHSRNGQIETITGKFPFVLLFF